MNAKSKLPEIHFRSSSWTIAVPSASAVIFVLVLIAGAVTPMLFSPWHHNAFELPKALASRALAGLALLGLLFKLPALRIGDWWRKSPLLPVLVLAFLLVVATLISPDPKLSLWGSYDRQFGLLTWLAPLALFGAAVAVLNTYARQRQLFLVIVWSSAPVVFYGLLQALGADPFAWDSDGASVVLGTMGRSNFLGSYLVMIIPLTTASLLLSAPYWPPALLLAGQVIVLGLTRARGSWFGLLGAALSFGLLWLLVKRRRQLASRLALLCLVFLVASIVVALLLGAPAGFTESGSTAARVAIWKATVPLLADRPLFGFGPDNMQLAFQRVFPPELVYYQGRHQVVDRAHNIWLDTAMSAGLLGLIVFVSVLWRSGRLMWRGLRSSLASDQQILLVGLSSAAIGHLIELQVSFETAGTALLFWLVLALGVTAANPSSLPHDVTDGSPRLRSWMMLPSALAFTVMLFILTARPLMADWAYSRGLHSHSASPATLRYIGEAKRQWPVEPLYQVALAQAYWASGQTAAAVSEATSAVQQRPNDARLWAAAGDLYAQWGAAEPTYNAQALAAYTRAIKLSPNTASYHTALGLILAQNGQLSEGIAAVERAVELDATDFIAFGHLAQLYKAAGQLEEADWAAAQAQYWSAKSS